MKPGALYHFLIVCFCCILYCLPAQSQLNPEAKYAGVHLVKMDTAQNIRMNFYELLENNEHLPYIIKIHQTKDDLLWLVTNDDGIIEYNGVNFIHYRNKRNDSLSLPSNRVTAIYEENQFVIWVATKNGICKFDRIKKTFIPFYLNNTTIGGAGFVKLKDGRLLCGTSVGLCLVNKTNQSLVPLPNQKIKSKEGKYYQGETIRSADTLTYDKDGKIWSNIMTQNLVGLGSFDLNLNEWTFYPDANVIKINKNNKAEKILTWCIYADDDDDRIWVGGYDKGLRCYSKSKGTWQMFYFEDAGIDKAFSNTINTIYANNKNELLLGTYVGLYLFNKNSLTLKKYDHPNLKHEVSNVMNDNCGNLWIGGTFGLMRLHPLNNRFVPVDNIAASPLHIQSFLQINPDNIMINYYQRSSKENVTSVLGKDKINSDYKYLWSKNKQPAIIKFEVTSKKSIITFGAGRITRSDSELKNYEDIPITLFENNGSITKDFTTEYFSVVKWNDSIYYACRRTTAELGFIKINIHTKTAHQYKPSGNLAEKKQPISGSIHGLYRDSYNRLWCCSVDRGLSVFSPATNTFEHYFSVANDKTSLPANLIRSVHQTFDKYIWITTSAGLCRTKALPGSKAVFELVVPDIECNYLYEDKYGYLWVNYKGGTIRVNIKSLNYRFYTKADGYNWDGYYAKKYLLSDGNFLMPDGIIFNPSALPQNTFKPVPFISNVKIYNDDLKADSSFPFKRNISLNHDQNFISINYSCNSYINEEKNIYAYKLEGVDTGWVDADNRTTAYYTQLQPGTYWFWVKAANNDGLYGQEKRLLTITIIPAWYQTWWFKLLSLLAVLIIVYAFYRQRINQEKAKGVAQRTKAELMQVKAEFEKQMAETEMIALRAQMNPHFIFNVLNSINKYILENESEKASHYLTQFSRLIRQVLENSKSSKISLEADLLALKLYIDMEKLRFGDKFNYTIDVQQNIDIQFTQLPPLLIQPYVENAIWHGLMQQETKGCLEIIITQPDENILQIIVQDNGIGRQKALELKSKSATKHKSFGMQLTNDRINMVNKIYNMEATVQYEDIFKEELAAGTRVILIIPV